MIRWTNLKLPGIKAMLCEGQRGDVLTFEVRPGRTRENAPH